MGGAARFELYLDLVAHPKSPGEQNQSYKVLTGSNSLGVHDEPVNAQSAVATGERRLKITLICLHGGHGDCRGCGCECHERDE